MLLLTFNSGSSRSYLQELERGGPTSPSRQAKGANVGLWDHVEWRPFPSQIWHLGTGTVDLDAE